MKEKFAVTKGRLTAFLLCLLLPVFAVAIGIRALITGFLFNVSFAVTFVLFPLIGAGLLAWCIFLNHKPLRKVILSGFILVLFVASILISSVFLLFVQVKHYEGAEAECQYSAIENSNSLMPALSEIGEPIAIEYHNVYISLAIFSSEADHLICRYTPEEYTLRKAALETNYVFQSETITHTLADCEPATEVDGYEFRLLSVNEYKGSILFPKRLMLIGYSDDAHEIVYIAFEDLDLDCISSLKEFIIHECGWKYIR